MNNWKWEYLCEDHKHLSLELGVEEVAGLMAIRHGYPADGSEGYWEKFKHLEVRAGHLCLEALRELPTWWE